MPDTGEEMSTEKESLAIQVSLYRRELPGGGYVAINIERRNAKGDSCRTRVFVERRGTEARRGGHQPLVIAEADGDEESPGFADMYKIAADNAAIARALLRLQPVRLTRAD
jgi:hypothetical protein